MAAQGVETVHVGDIGYATAEDVDILHKARNDGRVVVTLDADFHALMALSGAANPSVIRIRMEGLRAEGLVELLRYVIEQCREDLASGALVTVRAGQIRLRRLPLLPDRVEE